VVLDGTEVGGVMERSEMADVIVELESEKDG